MNIVLDRFQCRPYQIPLLDAIENKGYKKVLGILPRRAGKDICAWNLVIRQALEKVGVYFYIFPTYSQARKVIWDSLTNDSMRFLDYIPEPLVANTNSSEMKIRLINGSIIQLVGSDNIDSLLGTNPRGVVFSEYALQDPRAYQFIRPILTANNGWSLFISCVSPETLVITESGLSRIKNVSSSRERYSDLNKKIFGLKGFHNAEQFYYGNKQPTLKITLESGYQLECTSIHPIWNGHEWIKSQDLKVGDFLPIQYGQDVWGTGVDFSRFKARTSLHGRRWDFEESEIDNDFFYLLGLIHADGNYDKSKICVTNKKDPEIQSFLHSFGFDTSLDGMHHEYSSRELCSLLEYLGFKHGARNKTFPESLFLATKEQMRSFLQGLFDGDGTSNSHPPKRGRIKLVSTNYSFIRDLQIVLLNFGIVSGITTENKAPTKKVKVWSTIYNLEISGYFAHIFYRDIGFRLPRKQKHYEYVPEKCREESGNIYPLQPSSITGLSFPKNIVSNQERISRRKLIKLNKRTPHPYLEQLLSEKFFYCPIKEITPSENEVFDFVIPETHSFFSNGFISHNTPRGKNHLWELYQIATHNPEDWYCLKLTVEQTGHINLADIQRELQTGEMSEDLIQQEYYTSFEMGVEGAYYTKYLDKMRLSNRISIVPYEASFKVHTAWDLGVRDSTSIIFFQVIGQTVRLIDYYENSKVGLEHYITILKQKPYIYGKHIAPHDIKVTEFGTGLTRLEKARQLGINFTLAPDLSVEDGIEAVRSMFSKTWIDDIRCVPLIKALENYRQEFDAKKKIYKANPLHNWASHACDAMRYLAISLSKTSDSLSPQELDKRFMESKYGSQGHLPPMFRD